MIIVNTSTRVIVNWDHISLVIIVPEEGDKEGEPMFELVARLGPSGSNVPLFSGTKVCCEEEYGKLVVSLREGVLVHLVGEKTMQGMFEKVTAGEINLKDVADAIKSGEVDCPDGVSVHLTKRGKNRK